MESSKDAELRATPMTLDELCHALDSAGVRLRIDPAKLEAMIAAINAEQVPLLRARVAELEALKPAAAWVPVGELQDALTTLTPDHRIVPVAGGGNAVVFPHGLTLERVTFEDGGAVATLRRRDGMHVYLELSAPPVTDGSSSEPTGEPVTPGRDRPAHR